MSSHFALFTTIALFFLLVTYYRHRLNAGVLWIFFGAWIVPVWISQFSSLPLNKEWADITVLASIAVMLGLYGGYFTGVLLPVRFFANRYKSISTQKLSLISTILLLLALSSFIILFVSLGRPPLLSDSILENRKLIQEINPILWSITQFSFLSASIAAILHVNNCWTRLNKFLFLAVFIMILLTGWRNFLLMYVLYYILPFMFIRKYRLNRVFSGLVIFLFLFTLIGFVRGDLGEVFDLVNAISLIGLYVYPNFLNFESLALEDNPTSHVYTLQFLIKPILQLFEFNTSPPQTSIGAFNVATGLNPLYHDGGIVNIFFTTFIIGYLLQRLEKISNCSVLGSFWRSSFMLTVLFFHNGWLLLNFMPTYNSFVFIGFLILISVPQAKNFNLTTRFAIELDRCHR